MPTRKQEERAKKRQQAEEFYVYGNATIEEIALNLNLSSTQLRKWSAQGGWKAKRNMTRAASTTRLGDLEDALNRLSQQLKDKLSETDPPAKIRDISLLVSSVDRLASLLDKQRRRYTIGRRALTTTVMRDFALYLLQKDPDLSTGVADHLEAFLQQQTALPE